MTQTQLDRAVAGATGESLRMSRGLGFRLVVQPDPKKPETRFRMARCPFCECPVAPEESVRGSGGCRRLQ